MNDLLTTLESAPEWVWMIVLVALVIALMVRNQRQAYAYGVWDATHTPASPAVIKYWIRPNGEHGKMAKSRIFLQQMCN